MSERAFTITLIDAALLIALQLFYLFAYELSVSDDMLILLFIVPFFAWHALLIGGQGLRAYCYSGLPLFVILGCLLLHLFFHNLASKGMWRANRCIYAFGCSVVWFCVLGFYPHWRDRRRQSREKRGHRGC